MSERRILLLIAAVQFVNVLDFVMVMPLGPDFAEKLDIPNSMLGIVGGSYTLSAAVTGIAGSFFLDRFDRRIALAFALAGLILGTLAGGFAMGFGSMIAARMIAGAFGGPATSLSLAILADVVPPERRGRALGFVMGAFSVASVLGVPAGLELARLGSWRIPFFVVAGLGVVVAGSAVFLMPPMRLHLERGLTAERMRPFAAFAADPTILIALAAVALVTMGSFLLIPNFSAYLQFNLHYPRARLGLLYLVGGAVSFVTMRAAGVLIDRKGAFIAALTGTVFVSVILWLLFIHPVSAIPVLALFVGFMFSNSFRFVAMNTVGTKVPFPNERARYMSAQSAVQHLSSGAGAILSTFILVENADKSLSGIRGLGIATLLLSIPMPFLIGWVAHRVSVRAEAAQAERSAELTLGTPLSSSSDA